MNLIVFFVLSEILIEILLAKFFNKNVLCARIPITFVIIAVVLFVILSLMWAKFGTNGLIGIQIGFLTMVGIFGGFARDATSLRANFIPESEEITLVIIVHVLQNLVIGSILAHMAGEHLSWWSIFKPATAFGLISWYLISFAISYMIYFRSKRQKPKA
jgi:hypothetical protein